MTLRPAFTSVLLSIAASSVLLTTASGAPYVVYSGTATSTAATSAGSTHVSNPIYLLSDLADTSNFAILQFDAADKIYTVISRPSDTPPAGEAADNFFGGIVASNGKSGTGVLSYSTTQTDSSNNTVIARAYATGPLTTTTSQLVAARTKPLVVTLKANGETTGLYTFNSVPATSSGGNAYPKSLTGAFNNYEITSAGGLGHISSGGAMSLSLNTALTALANIGGSFTLGRNTVAVMPVSVADGTLAADEFAEWLSAFAQANGYALPYTNSSANVASGVTLSLGTSLSSGGLTYSGIISNPTAGAEVILPNGSLNWASGSAVRWAGALINPDSGGVLTLGASTAGTDYTVGPTTVNDYSGNTGTTLTLVSLNYGSGALTLSGTGLIFGTTTLTLLNNGATPGTLSGAIVIAAATVNITGVNSDSTLNGSIAITGSSTTTFAFTDMAFVNSSTTGVNVPTPEAGDVITCSLIVNGGTYAPAASSAPASITGGTMTLSNVSSDSQNNSVGDSGYGFGLTINAISSGGTLTAPGTSVGTTGGAIENTGDTSGSSLTKAGGGTFILNNSNTYSGSTTINGGTLSIAPDTGAATTAVPIVTTGTSDTTGDGPVTTGQ